MRPLGWLVLLTIVVSGCYHRPSMVPPGEWNRGDLPAGVVAESDLVTREVTYSSLLTRLPPLVESAVILHEVCHLRGAVTENGADCCAAKIFTDVYGLPSTSAVIVFWQTNRKESVLPWITCSF